MIDITLFLLFLGLWEGCFDRLQDDGHKYDNVISGCWNLLAEELYHLNELIFQRKTSIYY